MSPGKGEIAYLICYFNVNQYQCFENVLYFEYQRILYQSILGEWWKCEYREACISILTRQEIQNNNNNNNDFNYKQGNGLCIPAVPPYTNIR